jgi:Cu(I)/Ag(I) efflux system membrane fusion protein
VNRPILKFTFFALLLVGIGWASLWIVNSKHTSAEMNSACRSGQPAYWYDPMVPDQHFDKPGKSPFMDMQLVAKCTDAPTTTSSQSSDSEPKALYWYDPMVPNQHFDKPGKSPFMDMQLVAKYPDAPSASSNTPENSIAIDPRVVQTLGIRLAPVEQGQLAQVVDTVGVVGVDEHRIQVVQVRSPGWVERLEVRAAGDAVRRGQLLAGVYSPDLLAGQEEFLLALASGDAALAQSARQRLSLFGLSSSQIVRVEKTKKTERRVNYYSDFDGYVMELGVRQGAAVEKNTVLFQLADLSSVWINAEIPESQAAWVKAGDPVVVEVPALPGEEFRGRVDYVYPELTTATRTLKLRVVLKNKNSHLRPGMYATAHLQGAIKQNVLMVPTEAVIKTGVRSVIIVADDTHHFHPVLVRVGTEHGGKSEIIEGLSLGQNVVASGQFLIDSEASLRGAFDNLTGAGDAKSQANPMMPMPSTSSTGTEH